MEEECGGGPIIPRPTAERKEEGTVEMGDWNLEGMEWGQAPCGCRRKTEKTSKSQVRKGAWGLGRSEVI